MKVVSLFAGIGGFDLGFERAGFEIVAHVEKDKNCLKLLKARWPKAVALDDVCTAGAHNLPPCDVITFGFPCQDLSVAGKRGGLAGSRSGLYYEATRIIDELKPAYCLFENVPGLLSSEGGRDFARVLMEMDRIGYSGAWRLLDAQWFGVAQRRRRVFGLFSREHIGAERCAEILSLRESLRGHPAPCRETGQGVAADVEFGPASGRFTDVNPTLDTRCKDGPVRNQLAGCVAVRMAAFGEYVDDGTASTMKQRDYKDATDLVACCADDVARTLTARHDSSPCADRGMDVVATMSEPRCTRTTGGQPQRELSHCLRADTNTGDGQPCVQFGMSVRRLTPTECERLQGFPDGHTAGFADSVRYKMLGNAVAVPCAEWIARRMAAHTTKEGSEG